jgi:Domain of unknown function (DUF4350)
MTERFVTFACALGALVLFLLLFVNPEQGLARRKPVPRPTTEELHGNGYNAAFAWVKSSGVPAVSLRERFNALATRHDLAPDGNVLVVTLPGIDHFWISETKALRSWVHAGNTLIVLAALIDAPDWATATGGMNVADMRILAVLDFNPTPSREPRRSDEPAIVSNGPHVYFTDVRQVIAAAPAAQREWQARVPNGSFMLALAHERATARDAMWTRLGGNGRVLVVGAGSLFTDRALGRADNARLFANMMGASLGPRGAVIFDDFHQGLSSTYDPQKFYSDPRLYMTIAVLLLLWFAWVLGGTRLRVAPARAAAPREADLVRASGGFLARVLGSDVAAQRLFEYFFRRMRLRTSAPQSASSWEVLDAASSVSAEDRARLRRWHSRAYQGGRVPLVRLYNLILAIDRQIA